MGTSVMATISTRANSGLMKYRPASRTCSCRPLYPPALTKASPSWKELCPSTVCPAISPLGRLRPSLVVTMPTRLSLMSRTAASPTVNRAVLMRYEPGGMIAICGPRWPSFWRKDRAFW